MNLLSVRELAVYAQQACVLRELSFELGGGESLAIIGESGSGKTQAMLALLGLLAPGLCAQGSVCFDGEELIGAPEARLRAVRGAGIAYVWQDALASLNPYLRIGTQLSELLTLHQQLRGEAARAEALRLLDAVRLAQPALRLHQYPHELSGGMRQRVMLALALAGAPRLLIADEPTSALDISLRQQIVELLAELRRSHRLALIVITHDLSLVEPLCERSLVLYAGEMMEAAPSAPLLRAPRHPYTQALLRAQPSAALPPQSVLPSIAGSLPPLAPPRAHCVFAPRCAQAESRCTQQRPDWRVHDACAGRCHQLQQ